MNSINVNSINIINFYAEGNAANSIGHIMQVLQRALVIKGSPLAEEEFWSIVLHDCAVKARNGEKDNHALWSAGIAVMFLRSLGKSEQLISEVERAILAHDPLGQRVGVHDSFASELLASADESAPDIGFIMNKSYVWNRKRGVAHADAVNNVTNYMLAMYGSYSKDYLPRLYFSYYGSRVAEMSRICSNLTPEDTEAILREFRARNSLGPNDMGLGEAA
jgi:hypothetical protein